MEQELIIIKNIITEIGFILIIMTLVIQVSKTLRRKLITDTIKKFITKTYDSIKNNKNSNHDK